MGASHDYRITLICLLEMASNADSRTYGRGHGSETDDMSIGYISRYLFGLEVQCIGIEQRYPISLSFQQSRDQGQTNGWLRIPGELRGIYQSYFKHA